MGTGFSRTYKHLGRKPAGFLLVAQHQPFLKKEAGQSFRDGGEARRLEASSLASVADDLGKELRRSQRLPLAACRSNIYSKASVVSLHLRARLDADMDKKLGLRLTPAAQKPLRATCSYTNRVLYTIDRRSQDTRIQSGNRRLKPQEYLNVVPVNGLA